MDTIVGYVWLCCWVSMYEYNHCGGTKLSVPTIYRTCVISRRLKHLFTSTCTIAGSPLPAHYRLPAHLDPPLTPAAPTSVSVTLWGCSLKTHHLMASSSWHRLRCLLRPGHFQDVYPQVHCAHLQVCTHQLNCPACTVLCKQHSICRNELARKAVDHRHSACCNFVHTQCSCNLHP